MNKEQKSGMSAFIMMMASMMPIDKVLEMLEDSIKEYRINPSKENFKAVEAKCFLILNRGIIDDQGGGIDAAMKISSEIDEMRAKVEFFEPKTN